MIADTSVIVLKKYYVSEFTIIAQVFSRKFGKLMLASKHLRKHERFGGILDIASYNDVSFIDNIYEDINNIVRIDTIDKFSGIYTDLNKIFSVLEIVEIISEILPFRERHADIFDVLLELIQNINNDKTKNYIWDKILFYVFLLKHTGHHLCFSHCVCCGKKEKKFNIVSFEEGGVVCTSCLKKQNTKIRIPDDLYFYLNKLLSLDLAVIKKIKPSKLQISRIHEFLKNYFEYVLGKQVKSFKVKKECFTLYV